MQIIFLSGTKCLWLPQYVNQFFVWHKEFGPAQNILGPVKGQGINVNTAIWQVFELVENRTVWWEIGLFWRNFHHRVDADRDSNRDIYVTNNIETILLSSQRAADEADQDDEETINTGLDTIAAAGSLAVAAVGDQMKQVTSYVTKRAGFGLGSSKSSGCDDLIVASVPYLSLSGFIDSWHPFGSGRLVCPKLFFCKQLGLVVNK